MHDFSDNLKKQYDVVVIGGGATGAGILRDLSLRGLKAVLFESGDMASGTSSHFHGLLHSGARYAVKDSEAARECADENKTLRKIAKHCIEDTGGLFVRTYGDDPQYETEWLAACAASGVETVKISLDELFKLEPLITREAASAYIVRDAAVDGFRLVWHNLYSAKKHGADYKNYSKVISILSANGKVTGVKVKSIVSGVEAIVTCDVVVNAAGSWAKEVAKSGGTDIALVPDKGALLVYNHRFSKNIINRLRPPADGDIFVPHGSVTIFGTTSSETTDASDTSVTRADAEYLKKLAVELFPNANNYRALRIFAGTRPLLMTDSSHSGREASRNFIIIDHEKDNLSGFVSIFGGKLTTYRLMAEKVSDIVAAKFGNVTKCRTADESLLSDISHDERKRAAKVFHENAARLTYERLGYDFGTALAKAESSESKKQLLCECEFVTYAEFETVAALPESVHISDIRRRTRIGMGTCQGTFCAYRGLSAFYACQSYENKDAAVALGSFLDDRWHGVVPVLSDIQLAEAELARNIYMSLLNVARK